MTVIVNTFGVPEQVFKVGVTVIVDTCCAATFAAVSAEIFPIPEAAKPVAVLLFVHEKVAPVGVLVKVVAAMLEPPQTV